ncbi:hypothetical protein BDZ91DRAFT_547423 [Kalaharituber pfeilii]|nr:hypothetical protein BDZ91DRAFT_547423 [Kalaharituber pfeilii]
MQKNKTCPMPDQCCSSHGYCGTSRDYCKSPDCLVGFGLCDANIVPQGRNTSWVDRSMPENIRITMQGKEIGYGVGIYHCVHPGTVALTFDDGPYNFTSTLLDTLDEHHFKATFFVTGVNIGKGPIDDPIYGWDKVIRRMYNTGHQIASHTWSHADLDKLSEWDRRNEMYKLEMALRNIIGVIPTYMRPPYSSCSEKNGCLQTMRDMGYHVVYFDLDTQDYLMQTAEKIQVSKDIFSQALNPANSTPKADSHLVIAHDITEQSAKNLTVFMVEEMARMGWKGVTVGECLEEGQPGMGEGGWYRVAENETERSERLQREEGNPVTTGVDDTERGGGRDQWRGQPNAEDNKSEGQGLRVRGVGIWVVAAVVGGWLLGL